uniref:Major intrinsic protein n=1 Tax=viral metagenome TaxID=1070528 RepID=A0A6C0B5B0_9ZZZZ
MEIMKYLVEFLGTFIFLSVILTQGKPIPIAVALLAVIYFGGAISGGHFNPAVSVMMFFKKALPAIDIPFYIIAQLLGGLLALQFFNFTSAPIVVPPITV